LIKEIQAGKCPFLAPTKKRRDEANIAPFNDPKVEHATNKGIRKANIPNILSPNVTATANEARISYVVKTAKYATFVKTYIIVTTGMLIQIALGRFL
jgi:hypothetical protein